MKNNQRIQAAALKYNSENKMPVPVVVAKGQGKIAENIIAKAEEKGIPIQEDPSLVELLGQLEINEAIPEQLYQAVAEVFAFIYRLDQKAEKH